MAGEVLVTKTLFVLDLENAGGVKHQPAHVKEQRADDCKLTRVQLMRFVQILVIQLDQLDTLVYLKRRELVELLSEKVNPKLHGRLLVKVVEVLHFFGVLSEPGVVKQVVLVYLVVVAAAERVEDVIFLGFVQINVILPSTCVRVHDLSFHVGSLHQLVYGLFVEDA